MKNMISNIIKAICSPIRSAPAIYDRVWDFRKRLAACRFLYNRKEGARTLAEFSNCNSPEDFYELSSRLIGPVQIRSEIVGFLEMVRKDDVRTVCEIGIAAGGTNFLLTHAAGKVELMLAIDLRIRNARKLNFFVRDSRKLCFLQGSSYDQKTVEKARQALNGRTLDLLFIDGDHSYKGVKADFLCYRQFVRDGGIIAFHDIISDYTTRLGKKTEAYSGGVPEFWSQLRTIYPSMEFVANPEQDGSGIEVIRYDPRIKGHLFFEKDQNSKDSR